MSLKDCDLCENRFYPKGKCPDFKYDKCKKRQEHSRDDPRESTKLRENNNGKTTIR